MQLPDWFTDNPAPMAAAIRTLLQTLMTFAVAFGAPINAAQQTAVLELGAAIIAVSLLVSAVVAKHVVPKTPSASAPPSAIQAPQPPA